MDVSVVIPVRDRAAFLRRALASVAAQTEMPSEVIVVDDRSVDDSAAVAEEHGARVVRTGSALGPGLARNAGMAAASTGWVAFLDSDDVWAPHHLASLLAVARPEHVLVTAPGVSSAGRWRGNSLGREAPLNLGSFVVPGDGIVTSATMVRRTTALAVGGFPDQPLAQDMGLWLRLLAVGPGLETAEATCYYQVHDAQRSLQVGAMRSAHMNTLDADGAGWLTTRVRLQARSRLVWDELRATPSASAATLTAAWYACHPNALFALLVLLRQRARGRRAYRRRASAYAAWIPGVDAPVNSITSASASSRAWSRAGVEHTAPAADVTTDTSIRFQGSQDPCKPADQRRTERR